MSTALPALNDNPAFQKVVDTLLQVHALNLQGVDDSQEIDELHGNFEYYWWKLSDDEQRLVQGLSDDLAWVVEPAKRLSTSTSEDPLTIPASRDQWIPFLDFIRANESDIPPDQVALLRGRGWLVLDQHRVAAIFFREAYRLHSDDDLYGNYYAVLLLESLRKIGDFAELDRLSSQFLATSKSRIRRVASVCARFQLGLKVPSFLAKHSWEAIATQIRQEIDGLTDEPNTPIGHLLDEALIYLGFANFLEGKRQDAERACEIVRKRSPEHLGLRELRRFLDGEVDFTAEPDSINRLVSISRIIDIPPRVAA